MRTICWQGRDTHREKWLWAWDCVVDDLPQGATSVASDVVQFKALCRTLLKSVIAPLGNAASGSSWRDREQDVLRLPDLVASRLNYKLWHDGYERHSGAEFKVPYRRRRSINIRRDGPGTVVDLGVRTDLADVGQAPLWLRVRNGGWNDLEAVRSHLARSRFSASARTDAGHLWIPITIPPHVGDDALIDAMADEAWAIAMVVRGD